MMQATDFWNLDDHAELRPLDGPSVGCVFVEREMRSRTVVVREVAGQNAAQMALAEDEDVVQTLAPDGADDALGEGILPWALGAVSTSRIPMPFTRRRNA